MHTRTRVLLAFVTGLWLALPSQPVVVAMEDSHVCSELCGDGASCDAECWLTQFEFDQSYPSTTCGAQGYDCCGDGSCNPTTEACNVCPGDCGYVSTCETECYSNSQCGYGEVCNAAHECVPSSPTVDGPTTPECGGECTSNGGCCGADVCIGAPGQKYCGIPESTYCPNSPTCSESHNCDFGWVCESTPRDAYCDPGTNRCMFNQGFECPDWDEGFNVCIGT